MKQSGFFWFFFLPFCLTILFDTEAKAQGCSDAGFCTLEAFKTADLSQEEVRKQNIKLGLSYGAADNQVGVMSSFVEYGYAINEKFSTQAKLGFVSQQSDIASSAGLSDLFLSASYSLTQWRFTTGVKIPLTDGNVKKDGFALPMDFQPGLGTFDLVLGVGYQLNKLNLTVAAQQPLTHGKNSFLTSDFAAGSPFSGFISTNQYHRKGDVLLRAAYQIDLGEKWSVIPSVLPIYHLGNDQYTDESGKKVDLIGSEGLTLNGNIFLNYKLKPGQLFQLTLAAPFVTRDLRPDGLTRSFVVGLEYVLKFR